MVKAKGKPKGRTRKPAPPLTTEERVDRIAHLMVRGQWHSGKLRTLASAWGCGTREISKLADRASTRLTIASGKLDRKVAVASMQLEAIAQAAVAAGNFTAAIKAVTERVKLAGAYKTGRQVVDDDSDSPTGLPPELARLNPPPSFDEVSHFAAVDSTDACTVEGCRVHGKPGQAAPPVH